ncbi:protein-L-isoaspartate(D-aspartate) O-methyltransferase [Helicobacter trogontum]|uniref:protein-L-isoaspartate(D-aspartate) O-methyltransferase n=1 Tax=Helicobacter trogontum TaxID=50960 RepID=UPI0018837F16|nr:protein-L-isoaspartate(D-aspartate) O-methyltransferase [Helicobacter trogontum]MCI5787229.1 protein-L-isoaspartate(D-aspartate) O-methyltransferase [Helicobacter trogontum]MDY5185502.1 protein-L-isoaspartate(D-aspartate) O-methyltransferase [Helicobacter trogontum]
MHEIKNMEMLKDVKDSFDPRVIAALRQTDREFFVPSVIKHSAFHLDNALPISDEQWISAPLTVAKMTTYLMAYDLGDSVLEPDSVLEIGLGSGYQAVVLSHLIRRVFSIERIESLWLEARARIAQLQIMNINIKLDDGMNGWSSFAPYDRILLSACTESIPKTLIDQLQVNGVLVAPMYHNGGQVIVRFVKQKDNALTNHILESCQFVPIKQGVMRMG